MADKQTPFPNCRYDICDLPGQCRSEGKCHHPSADLAGGQNPVDSRSRLRRIAAQKGEPAPEFGAPASDRVSVPREPTNDMVRAALYCNERGDITVSECANIYRAMISAAPQSDKEGA